MGAATVTVTENYVQGNKRVTRGTLHASTSYASGGETFTAAQFGLSRIDSLQLEVSGGYVPAPDLTNLKVLIYQQSAATSALTQASGDLSATLFPYIAEGA